MKKLLMTFFGLFVFLYGFAQNPALEMAAGDGNPTGNGPVTSTTIQFRNNTNNPAGNTFATYTPAVTVDATLTNQQYNFAGIAPNAAVVFGYANGGYSLFPIHNDGYGSPVNADFTGS